MQTRRVIALAFLWQMWWSWRLWYPLNRTYPQVSVLFENVILDTLSVMALCFGWCWLLVFPCGWQIPKIKKSITTIPLILGAMVAVVLSDLTRLQVWLWFYFLVLVLTAIPRFSEEQLRGAYLLLATAVYAWGGFNKLNPIFQSDIFPWLCSAGSFFPKIAEQKNWAIGIALFEMSLAGGLIWQVTRRYFRWITVVFHLSNILMLSSLGLNWNQVVIPWNLAMAILVLLATSEKVDFAFWRATACKSIVAGVLCLAWVAPLLNFFSLFPENLSWKMYAGTHPEATLFFENHPPCTLPSAVAVHIFGEQPRFLTLDDWAMTELGVPPFATKWAFHSFHQKICAQNPAEAGTYGLYFQPATPFGRDDQAMEKWLCGALLGE